MAARLRLKPASGHGAEIAAPGASVRAAPHVAVLLESSTTWGSKALRGIADYLRSHQRWSLLIEPRGWYEKLKLPDGWRGDGIIARVTNQPLVRQINTLGVPVVNLSFITFACARQVQVTSDEMLLGREAATHLLDRGFRHFGYLGVTKYSHYVDRCGKAFTDTVREGGGDVHVYRVPQIPKDSRDWHIHARSLGEWVQSLPKPTGIYTWNSERGRMLLDVCMSVDVRVPEEVAVLAGDNDDVLSELCHPPLSGIDQGPRRIGYAAAMMLDKLMAGEPTPDAPVLFAPVKIAARQSTDVMAVPDTDVATALQYIREHVHEGIQVSDVVDAVPLSRRTLEQRFIRLLGRSPSAEIQRVRLEYCKRLLTETDWPLNRVAEAAGFNHSEVMIRTFRRSLGLTPSQYRKQARL